jgi:hypothetical protein
VLNSIHTSSVARRHARHMVELPCDIITQRSDEPHLMWATDLSAGGMWLESTAPLVPGDELVVCFRPSVWWRMREITVFAEVARASHGHRGEDDVVGMGLSFLDLERHEKWALRCWLRPRPFRAAKRRLPAPAQRELELPPLFGHPFASRVS